VSKLLVYAGSNLDEVRRIFERAIKHLRAAG
jgi:hypothetical protein